MNADDQSSNLSVILRELRSAGSKGYHVQVFKILTSDYGLPQKRERLYFVGAHKGIYQEFNFGNVQSMLQLFRLECQPPAPRLQSRIKNQML